MPEDISRTVLGPYIIKAEGLGADGMEVEHKDGHEEICAMKDCVGFGIGRLKSGSPEAKELRRMLRAMRRKTIVVILGAEYEIKVRVFESFGEDAFEVKFRRIYSPG